VAVVDVARPVPHPQDLSGLRQVRGQRVVRGILGVVRVEAARRAVDLGSGPQYRAVQVDRQSPQLRALDLLVDQVPDHIGQREQRLRRETLEQIHHRAIRGQSLQRTEAQQHRVDPQEGQVRDAHPAHDQHPDQGQQDAGGAVVAR
jgi:hypothetical protein